MNAFSYKQHYEISQTNTWSLCIPDMNKWLKSYPKLQRKNWLCLLLLDIFQFQLEDAMSNYYGLILSETLSYGIELPIDAIGSGTFWTFMFNNLSLALSYMLIWCYTPDLKMLSCTILQAICLVCQFKYIH